MEPGPKFVIYPDHQGEWRFRLVAGNNEIQAGGEGYSTHEHAAEGVDAVVKNVLVMTGTIDPSEDVPQSYEVERLEDVDAAIARDYPVV